MQGADLGRSSVETVGSGGANVGESNGRNDFNGCLSAKKAVDQNRRLFRRAQDGALAARRGGRGGRGGVGGARSGVRGGGAKRLLADVRERGLLSGVRLRFRGTDFRGELFDYRVGNVAFRTVPNDRVLVGFLERDDFFRNLARGVEFDFRVNDQEALLLRDDFDRVLNVGVSLVKKAGALRDDAFLHFLRFEGNVGITFPNGAGLFVVFFAADFELILNAGEFLIGRFARFHHLRLFGLERFDEGRHFVRDARMAFENGAHIDDADEQRGLTGRLRGGSGGRLRRGARSRLTSGRLLSFGQTANQAERGAKKRAGKRANVFHFEFSLIRR